MKYLALLGAGGHGKVIAEIAELLGYDKIVFFDDDWPQKQTVGQWSVIGDTELLLANRDEFDECVISVGNNKVREEKYRLLVEANIPIATLIHPSSVVSRYAEIGEGSVIMAGALVNIGVEVGLACIINTGAVIDHDCSLGDFSHISPGACLAGNIKIGQRTWAGIGSSIKQGIYIADDVVVGAGAAVVANVEENMVVVGIPAKQQ